MAGLGISTYFVHNPSKNECNPPPPKQKGYFTQQLLSAAQGSVKLEASREGPAGGGYLFSPAVLLVPANNPHGSFCLAWKTC